MATDKPGFLDELKRRHVWRVAVAYAITGWLLVQVATQVFPFFNIPNWTVRLVVVVLLIGLPIAVLLAWVYEITPAGIRRTAPADSPEARPERVHRDVGRKLDAVIIVVLVLAVVLMGWRLLALRHAAASGGVATSARAAAVPSTPVATASAQAVSSTVLVTVPEKSVAVLPFANDGGKPDQQYFSDGLSDDLITALSQFEGLKVISRDSAFQFRDSKHSSAEIGQLLGVAHLLEGSVQRAGGKVRITATLVNANDGSVLWSRRYDKPYTDLFKLQDDITHSVADALKARLLTAPGAVLQSDRPPSGNLAAYVAYQRGVADFELGTEVGTRQAIASFDDAVRLDPRYGAAFAQLSFSWLGLSTQFLTDAKTVADAHAKARAASTTALALEPDLALAHKAHMALLLNLDMDWTGAEAEAQRALQLAPNDAGAESNLGNALATLGQNRQAVELTRRALLADPRNTNWYQWQSLYFDALGDLQAGRQAINTAISLQHGAAASHYQLAVTEILLGDPGAAMDAAQKEPAGPWHDIAVTMALQVGVDRHGADAALRKLVTDYAAGAPYQIAEVYALRRDPDNTFHWLERAWTARDPGLSTLLHDPFILRYQRDPRFAAFCTKIGLPTTTDAVAMK